MIDFRCVFRDGRNVEKLEFCDGDMVFIKKNHNVPSVYVDICMLLYLPPHLLYFQLAKPSMCSTSDIYVALQPPGKTAELCIHPLSEPEDKVIKFKTIYNDCLMQRA